MRLENLMGIGFQKAKFCEILSHLGMAHMMYHLTSSLMACELPCYYMGCACLKTTAKTVPLRFYATLII